MAISEQLQELSMQYPWIDQVSGVGIPTLVKSSSISVVFYPATLIQNCNGSQFVERCSCVELF